MAMTGIDVQCLTLFCWPKSGRCSDFDARSTATMTGVRSLHCLAKYLILLDHVGKGADKKLPILIVPDDRLAVIASSGHMIDCAGVDDAQGSSHALNLHK